MNECWRQKVWIAAAAKAGLLPGVPTTPPRVDDFAKRKKLRSRKVKGCGLRGGRREYDITPQLAALNPQQQFALDRFYQASKALPAVAADRKASADAKSADVGTAQDVGGAAGTIITTATAAETGQVASGKLDADEVSRAQRSELFERATGGAKRRAQERNAALQFTEDLFESRLHTREQADHLAGQKFKIEARMLREWRSWVKGTPPADWLYGLLDQHHGRPRAAAYDETIFELARSDYLRLDRPPWASCYRRAVKIAKERGVDDAQIPTAITLWRRLKSEIPWQSIKAAREGERALHRSYPHQTRDYSVLHALECVIGDGYRCNVAVRWPDGEIVRPLMWSWQDAYSGKILAWRIDKSENASLIRLTTGDVLRDYGIPEIFCLDNTLAASSKWLSGGSLNRNRFKIRDEDPIGLFPQIGSRLIRTLPRVGGSSKKLERGQGDFDRDITRGPALAGSWLGTNPLTRPEAARVVIALEKFTESARQGLLDHNARSGRRGGVCNGRSFDEVFRES